MDKLFVIKYSGPFGFIKPWTAVRDSETYSQQFLTPSIITGIERKLFPELLIDDDGEIKKIYGHRLSYKSISIQQEVIQSRGFNTSSKQLDPNDSTKTKITRRETSILNRGVMVEPILFLAFNSFKDAEKASKQHICLCRNEDLMYPSEEIFETNLDDFVENEESFPGFELVFEKREDAFIVGKNRYKNGDEMYGHIRIVGNPIRELGNE
ncbi:MAG: hypothetical protein N4A32_08640 [Marinifilaceae bacterium]|jgi:hypothetical protein|nr:hypothetical protein [Marinilabiliaceae bacterium JC040]MCT4600946.1 hypothetical protein [Marinifilaceae bacterium]